MTTGGINLNQLIVFEYTKLVWYMEVLNFKYAFELSLFWTLMLLNKQCNQFYVSVCPSILLSGSIGFFISLVCSLICIFDFPNMVIEVNYNKHPKTSIDIEYNIYHMMWHEVVVKYTVFSFTLVQWIQEASGQFHFVVKFSGIWQILKFYQCQLAWAGGSAAGQSSVS